MDAVQSCGFCVLISCKQLQQSWQALLSWLSWSCHSIFGISDLRSTRSISSTCPNPFCGLVLVWCPQTWQLTAPPHPKIHSSPMTHDTTLHTSSTARSHVTKGPRQLHMAQTTPHTNTIHLHLRPSPSTQIRPPAQQRSFQYLPSVQQHTLASQSRLSILLHGRQVPTRFSLMASTHLVSTATTTALASSCSLPHRQHPLHLR